MFKKSIKHTIKSEKGDVKILMIFVIMVASFMCITFIGLMGAMYQRHCVDAALESATLAGAVNVVVDSEQSSETEVVFSKKTADKQANIVFRKNLANLAKNYGGENNSVVLKDFTSFVKKDRGVVWYNTTAIVDMPVTISILRYSLRYRTSCRVQVENNEILK